MPKAVHPFFFFYARLFYGIWHADFSFLSTTIPQRKRRLFVNAPRNKARNKTISHRRRNAVGQLLYLSGVVAPRVVTRCTLQRPRPARFLRRRPLTADPDAQRPQRRIPSQPKFRHPNHRRAGRLVYPVHHRADNTAEASHTSYASTFRRVLTLSPKRARRELGHPMKGRLLIGPTSA